MNKEQNVQLHSEFQKLFYFIRGPRTFNKPHTQYITESQYLSDYYPSEHVELEN
jgi:hypothetical protein